MARGAPFAPRAALKPGRYKRGERWYQREGAWCSFSTHVSAPRGGCATRKCPSPRLQERLDLS